MARSSDRPYGGSSISELEAVYRNARADTEVLRMLDHELGHRTTKRASRLRSAIVEARAGRLNSGSVAPPAAREGSRTAGLPEMISLPNAMEHPASQSARNPGLNPKTFIGSGPLRLEEQAKARSREPRATRRSEPAAILATWTALDCGERACSARGASAVRCGRPGSWLKQTT